MNSRQEDWQDYLDECRMMDDGCGCFQPDPLPPEHKTEVKSESRSRRWARWLRVAASLLVLVKTWVIGVILIDVLLVAGGTMVYVAIANTA